MTNFIYCYSQTNSTTDWIYVGTGSGDNRYYIKTENISKNTAFIKVWGKVISPVNKVKENGKEVIYLNTREMILWEFDCKNLKMRIISNTLYLSDGTFVRSNNALDEFNYVIPESMGESVLIKACDLFK
jgi:hypothetical protein